MSPRKRRTPITDESIGALVRARRQKTGIKFNDLAEALGVTPTMLQRYETGINSWRVTKLIRAAEVLKCKILDLIP